MLLEEITMEEVAVEFMKAVVETTEDAAGISEAVTEIMVVTMMIMETVTEEITKAMTEIFDTIEAVVEASEIIKTDMKEDIKMDYHEDKDSQVEEVVKMQKPVNFVMTVVCAKSNGWAWDALKYTSWKTLRTELTGYVTNVCVLNVANPMTDHINASGENLMLPDVKFLDAPLVPLCARRNTE